MSQKKYRPTTGTLALPDPLKQAVLTASLHLKKKEDWIPEARGSVDQGISRILSIATLAVRKFPHGSPNKKLVRHGIIQILSYLEAGRRISVMIDLAARDPAALDDLIVGEIDQQYMGSRYNILVSLGIFARHGLINEVLTRERLESVSGALGRANARLSAVKQDEEIE